MRNAALCWPTTSSSSVSPRSPRSATIFVMGHDGRTLVYRSRDRLRAIDALVELPEEGDEQKPPSEPGRRSGWIELDRANVEIVPRDEWSQMYREAWRLQTEHFWVADMSDIDWDRVYDRYAALLAASAHARRAVRSHLGDARRTRHVARLRDGAATIASRRNTSAASSAPTCAGTRNAAVTASSASIAATRGIAIPTRRSPNPASTCAKATSSSQSAERASRAT